MSSNVECIEYNENSGSLYYVPDSYEYFERGFYFSDECGQLVGPYDSLDEARKAMLAYSP